MTPPRHGHQGGSLCSIISILFLLSGATGLAYQVVWFKRLSYVWGNSSFAMAAAVASFLCGLGIGASLGGRLADRVRSPLLWYGAFEAVIGLLALAVPRELQALSDLAARLYPSLHASPLLHALARFGLTFIVLGPPCILMGSTLPLLVRRLTPRGAAAGRATGWLYGINTLGAAIGCYATGFHVLPAIGLQGTTWAVAALNVVVGAIAVAADRAAALGEEASGAEPAPSPAEERLQAAESDGPSTDVGTREAGRLAPAPRSTLRLIHIAAALAGAGALILEMVWARQLALILGGSTYAFTATLLVVLVGIGAGSLVFHVAREQLVRMRSAEALVIALIALSTAAGKWLIPALTAVVSCLGAVRSSEVLNGAICAGASAVLELVPALGMGILFPLLVDRTRKGRAEAGRAVGGVYAFNTAGSIVGAAATSILLVPHLGTSGAVALALGLYGVALFVLLPAPAGWRASIAFFLLCLATGAGIFLSLAEDDPRITNRGGYLYGPASASDLEAKVLFFEEGPSSNVLVTGYGPAVSLRVNGKVDASNFGDMKMQVGSAYLPLMLAPDSREVLVIGFGSGTTAGCSLLFPDVRVTCCEIEPAVVAASKHFHEVNHRPEESPRFTVVNDDGRSFLQGEAREFDLILSEPSNPWLAGLSSLYSREYYEVVRERLSPRGILAQWLQTYSFSPEDYALVAGTLLDAFPHVAFVRISEGDTLLLASSRPLEPDRETADRAQSLVDSIAEVRTDLERYFEMTDVREILLTHILLDGDGLRRLVEQSGAGVINTDSNLRLEFDAPLRLFRRSASSEAVWAAIQSAMSAEPFRRRAGALECGPAHAGAIHKVAFLLDKDRRPEVVRELVDLGLSLDPGSPQLLADRLILSPPADAAALQAVLPELITLSVLEASRVALSYLREKKDALAQAALEVLVKAAPGSTTAWIGLARAHKALGQKEKAREAIDHALALDPLDEVALRLTREMADEQ